MGARRNFSSLTDKNRFLRRARHTRKSFVIIIFWAFGVLRPSYTYWCFGRHQFSRFAKMSGGCLHKLNITVSLIGIWLCPCFSRDTIKILKLDGGSRRLLETLLHITILSRQVSRRRKIGVCRQAFRPNIRVVDTRAENVRVLLRTHLSCKAAKLYTLSPMEKFTARY